MGSNLGFSQWVKDLTLLPAVAQSQTQLKLRVARAVAEPAAATQIQPRARELPCVTGVAIKRKKRGKDAVLGACCHLKGLKTCLY